MLSWRTNIEREMTSNQWQSITSINYVTECFLWLSCSCSSWGPYQASPASMQPSSVLPQSTAHRGPGCLEMVHRRAAEADCTQAFHTETQMCIRLVLLSTQLWICTTNFAWYKSGKPASVHSGVTTRTVFLWWIQ